ncbi:hypothetical protein NPIL_150271 [Nephila pilipes]|uniref:Uncharacterized protein n=1 Tax=Nephila pilipes TaxID=299642 RepID=A0A8X6PTP8_NEPPI|nr:hypothetical protein NPIL_150271 [Nephila pilipes]
MIRARVVVFHSSVISRIPMLVPETLSPGYKFRTNDSNSGFCIIEHPGTRFSHFIIQRHHEKSMENGIISLNVSCVLRFYSRSKAELSKALHALVAAKSTK